MVAHNNIYNIYYLFVNKVVVVSQLNTHDVVEVCGKILYQVELARSTLDIMWGFSVEAELVENNEKQVERQAYVTLAVVGNPRLHFTFPMTQPYWKPPLTERFNSALI